MHTNMTCIYHANHHNCGLACGLQTQKGAHNLGGLPTHSGHHPTVQEARPASPLRQSQYNLSVLHTIQVYCSIDFFRRCSKVCLSSAFTIIRLKTKDHSINTVISLRKRAQSMQGRKKPGSNQTRREGRRVILQGKECTSHTL